ncbi:MAG: hypothetical protein HYV17_06825 [Xanthomonadales bacterium]|nr:hypothetical protein [Xanthomonadales bacterium]
MTRTSATPMHPALRWSIAIGGALLLLGLLVGVFVFGLLAMAFGADSCGHIGEGLSMTLLIGSPLAMALGVIVAAVLFGLNQRPQLWLGALGAGGVLGVCGYVGWFVLVSQRCG